MDYKIVWTDHAIEDYRCVIDYLLLEWSESVAINFVHTVEEIERAILQIPQSGKIAYKDTSVRGRLVTKHNKIYYRISERTIEILQMRDTRLSPEKNHCDSCFTNRDTITQSDWFVRQGLRRSINHQLICEIYL